MKMAVGIGVGVVDAPTIDTQNILEASRLAMKQAILQLSPPPDYLVLDATGLPSVSLEQRLVIKGDGLSLCVAAASIIAKVTRDRLMVEAHLRFPEYGFGTHKGYGTKEHLRQLRRLGPCELHRRSFRGVRELAGR
jgi:ribonuclease HII